MKVFSLLFLISFMSYAEEEEDLDNFTETPSYSEVSPQRGARAESGDAGQPFDFSKLLEWRDPFQRPVRILPKEERPLTPLERFPVAELKFLGVVTGPKKLRAMIQAPDGKSYFVSVGEKIGRRGGEVKNITINTLTVLEVIENVLGQKENFETKLTIPEEGKKIELSQES